MDKVPVTPLFGCARECQYRYVRHNHVISPICQIDHGYSRPKKLQQAQYIQTTTTLLLQILSREFPPNPYY